MKIRRLGGLLFDTVDNHTIGPYPRGIKGLYPQNCQNSTKQLMQNTLQIWQMSVCGCERRAIVRLLHACA